MSNSIMKCGILALALIALPVQAATYGQPLPQGEARDLASALAAGNVDQPQLLSGRITEVCQKQGCWAVLEHEGKSARLMMHDHAFFLPKDYRGAARVYGQLSRVELSAEEAEHMAEESSSKAAPVEVEYRVDALGVDLLEEGRHGD